jgi:threonine synthase
MGVPIDKLVIATNDNDVLHRFLKNGVYERNPAVVTIAPSMDISVSSNFERYLFYLTGESGEALKTWMQKFESTGKVAVSQEVLDMAKSEFLSYPTNEAEIVDTMSAVWTKDSYMLCPHTATAVAAIKNLKLPSARTVCLATAHPAKFEEALNKALKGSTPPARPHELTELFSLPSRSFNLPNSLRDVETFIRTSLSGKSSWVSYVKVIAVSAFAVGLVAAIGAFLVSAERARKSR